MIKKMAIVALSTTMWFATAHAIAEFGFVNKAVGTIGISCSNPSGGFYPLALGKHVDFKCQKGSVSLDYGGIPITNTYGVNQLAGCWDIYPAKDSWVKVYFKKAVYSDCGMR